MAQAIVTGIEPSARSDGSHVLQIKNAQGRAAKLVIPSTMVAAVQSALQRTLVERAFSVAKIGELTTGVSLPRLTVEQIATASLHGGINLCSRTPQIGWVSIEASDDVLRETKEKIDVVLASRAKH